MHDPIAAYAELHCLSNYSFLHGASHPEELVGRAAALGYCAIAITDECSLAGVVKAHQAAKTHSIQLICGSFIRFTPSSDQDTRAEDEVPLELVLLATDREGYANLSELITRARTRSIKGTYRAHLSDLDGTAPDAGHLRGLTGCLALLVAGREVSFERLMRQALWLRRVFGERCWVSCTRLLYAEEDLYTQRLARLSAVTGLPLVATGQVLMHVRSRKPLHDVLSAIRLKRPLQQCGTALMRNAEQHLRPRMRLAQLHPAVQLEAAAAIAARCHFSLDELRYEYPQEVVPAGWAAAAWLRELCEQGLAQRYPAGAPSKVLLQLQRELRLIAELKYEPFFLTVHDLVQFARSQGILCQGRGSAANSVVCYALHITEVDPAEMEMLFERFISRERNEPPDIDVDFEHQRREEVIQYIYAKYGRHRTALAATVITYQARSALRDIGKALGIDAQRIEQVTADHQWWDGYHIRPEGFVGAGFEVDSQLIQQWMQLCEAMLGFPRHLSQHVGGFVIAQDKLSRLVPVENTAMPARSVIQWDKDDLEALGLLKVDVLALGMLSAIRRALGMVSQRVGRRFEMQDIPGDDAATYDMICQADTVGVFQIESRAQMSMLPRLQPRNFYDLVIEVAIVRPGPIEGGMVHPYLRRRCRQEAISYPSPEVEAALQRTLGVPIFQEQVMQLAMLCAEFTPGEADQLRRAMAAWKRKGGLERFQDRLVGRMVARGYSKDFASALYRQIQGFGEYGFPEAHAASFAKLVYVSCWIKRHHPAAFLIGLLNAQPLGFYQPAQLIADAKRHGVSVLPADVMHSDWECGFDKRLDCAVRLGLCMVKGVSEALAQRIIGARHLKPFYSIEDMALSANVLAADVEILASAGCLHSFTANRHEAGWHAAGLAIQRKDLMLAARTFEAKVDLPLPTVTQSVRADYLNTGFSLSRHPVALIRPQLAKQGYQLASALHRLPTRRLTRACGIVTHRQRPQTAKGTVFITLEDESGPLNVIVWERDAVRYRQELHGASLLGVYGVWQIESGVSNLLARRLINHDVLLAKLRPASRDFR